MRAFILIFLTSLLQVNCKLPSYINVCPHDHPDLSACIKNSIETLKPQLRIGIPEINVPSMEPLPIGSLRFSPSSGSNFTNVEVYGASDFKILKMIPTLTKKGYTFRVEVIIPNLKITGTYNINTELLRVQLKGSGPFNASIDDFHFECILKGHKITKNEKNYFEFNKMKCNIVFGKTSLLLKNLFNGNAALEKATEEVISKNSEALFQQIKPELTDVLVNKFTEIANRITLSFTYEELFP